MKTYEQYKEELREELKEILPGISLEETEVRKPNGPKEAFLIRPEDSAIAVSVYPGQLYEGKVTPQNAARQISRDLEDHLETGGELNRLLQDHMASVKGHLYPEILCTGLNEGVLTDCPYAMLPGTDLAITARLSISDTASTRVSHTLLKTMNLSQEELFESAALHNREYSLRSLGEAMAEAMGSPEDAAFFESQGPQIYVLMSKEPLMEGTQAAVLANPEALSDAHSRLGDFTILPSSRMEVLLVPDTMGMEAEALEAMVRQVNGDPRVMDQEDILSNHIYHFDGERLTMGGPAKKEAPEKYLTRGAML